MHSLLSLPSPLPDGEEWKWLARDGAYARIYHRDYYTRSATHRRDYGPLARFDHHTPPATAAAVCPKGRSVTYIAETVRAAASEVFSATEVFGVCPNWRLAWLKTSATMTLQNLVGTGAMALRTKPSLGSGAEVAREDSQEQARRIYSEHGHLAGIRYTGSHEEGRCLVLWDRAPDLVVVEDGEIDCDASIAEDDETWAEVIEAYAPTGFMLERIPESECGYCREAAEAAEAATARA